VFTARYGLSIVSFVLLWHSLLCPILWLNQMSVSCIWIRSTSRRSLLKGQCLDIRIVWIEKKKEFQSCFQVSTSISLSPSRQTNAVGKNRQAKCKRLKNASFEVSRAKGWGFCSFGIDAALVGNRNPTFRKKTLSSPRARRRENSALLRNVRDWLSSDAELYTRYEDIYIHIWHKYIYVLHIWSFNLSWKSILIKLFRIFVTASDQSGRGPWLANRLLPPPHSPAVTQTTHSLV
jgi:hypothetical protein